MADTAITDEEDKKEYFDTEEELEEKIDQLANFILSSEHFISFTGGKLFQFKKVLTFNLL